MTTKAFGQGYHFQMRDVLLSARSDDLQAAVSQNLKVLKLETLRGMDISAKIQHVGKGNYTFMAYRFNTGDRPCAPRTSWWSAGVVTAINRDRTTGALSAMIFRSTGAEYIYTRDIGHDCYFIDPADIFAAREAFNKESRNFVKLFCELKYLAKRQGLGPPDEKKHWESREVEEEQRQWHLWGYSLCMEGAAHWFEAFLQDRPEVDLKKLRARASQSVKDLAVTKNTGVPAPTFFVAE